MFCAVIPLEVEADGGLPWSFPFDVCPLESIESGG